MQSTARESYEIIQALANDQYYFCLFILSPHILVLLALQTNPQYSPII